MMRANGGGKCRLRAIYELQGDTKAGLRTDRVIHANQEHWQLTCK